MLDADNWFFMSAKIKMSFFYKGLKKLLNCVSTTCNSKRYLLNFKSSTMWKNQELPKSVGQRLGWFFFPSQHFLCCWLWIFNLLLYFSTEIHFWMSSFLLLQWKKDLHVRNCWLDYFVLKRVILKELLCLILHPNGHTSTFYKLVFCQTFFQKEHVTMKLFFDDMKNMNWRICSWIIPHFFCIYGLGKYNRFKVN